MALPRVPSVLNSSDNDLTKEFYEPCLSWATTYDRAVGYFTSSWLAVNARGLGNFASRRGRARWITSPILDAEDKLALEKGMSGSDELLVRPLLRSVDDWQKSLASDTRNMLAWMVYDGILEFRFAVPTCHLEGGDFHDKFGIFADGEGNRLSFNGSVNDSEKGTVNYESIKVFKSWEELGHFVDDDEKRFSRLWEGRDENVRVFTLPEAVKQAIFRLRTNTRPYPADVVAKQSKWRHQDEAVQAFLNREHGILEMATGTGKTRTAIRIANELLARGAISRLVVTAYGTDLLDQWYKNLLEYAPGLVLCRYYDGHAELADFLLHMKSAALIVSRSPEHLCEVCRGLRGEVKNETLLICDEVHGMGSTGIVNNLAGRLRDFRYRLGLSATPEREYDEDGNAFIEAEIGGVIYRFDLEDAIRRGILCEFDYYPLEYELTQDDRDQIRRLIASFESRRSRGDLVDEAELYRSIARVRKTSRAKLPVFEQFLKDHPEVLDRAIVFVETVDFGTDLQNILIRYRPDYHTYYGSDDRANLTRFARGELDFLITCKRISEGIDIRSVRSIVLFSADRAKLQSIQRIGRCLRLDPSDPTKRSSVVDFVRFPEVDDESDLGQEESADVERREWLMSLSQIRREEE